MMKLYCSANSPYARKVRVVAHELGIIQQIEMIDTNPRDPDNGFRAINPVSKIPALIAANGDLIMDSPVICEYLNDVYGQGRLLSAEPAKGWKMRSLVALADATLDAGMAVRVEHLRPDALQSEEWVQSQFATAQRGLVRLEQELEHFENGVNLIGISVGATLGWLIFRYGEQQNWLSGLPKLAAWYQQFQTRPSMQVTAPGQALESHA